jgi:tetratricopeptide (TPR) repeat protein
MFSTATGDVAEDGKGSRNRPLCRSVSQVHKLARTRSPDGVGRDKRDDGAHEQRAASLFPGSIISDKRYSLNPDRRAATYAGADMALEFFEEGMSRMSGSNWDGAIESFTVAIRLDPQDDGAHNGRGFAYIMKNDYARARANWEKALQINPNNAAARNNLEHLQNEGH